MKVDRTLAVQVAAAVGAMLVGRESITLDEVEQALPATLRAGKPSHKSMTKALERFSPELNQRGFTRPWFSDSRSVLAKEAGMDGSSFIA